ncbi:MAG: DJ-1/PfpI family protein [Patescibacteria group bacterium]|nr:DJ-1/PfpI family protein [Patescibacteria group bacterium]
MNKKILMVVAEKDFMDEEYFIPREFFEKSGYEVVVMSSKKGLAIGVFGGEVVAGIDPKSFNPENLSALVFVGGPGAVEYLDNQDFYEVVQKTEKEGVVLGAICISPVILAGAGVLKNKKATVWSSDMDKRGVERLKQKGALYKKEKVVIDGKTVTANGPDAATEFAEKVVETVDKNI